MFRRLYNAFAMLAFGIVLVLSGFVATLATRGALTADRIDAALAALRGEAAQSPEASSQPASQSSGAEHRTATMPAHHRERDIVTTELDRREREIADQWELLRSAQMEFIREREKFAQEKRLWEATLKRQAEEASLSGAAKELELISELKPKDSKELLRQKKDADVVQLLLKLDTRTGRKIIESCKTDEERQWIGRILEQLRQRNDRQAEDLTAGNP